MSKKLIKIRSLPLPLPPTPTLLALPNLFMQIELYGHTLNVPKVCSDKKRHGLASILQSVKLKHTHTHISKLASFDLLHLFFFTSNNKEKKTCLFVISDCLLFSRQIDFYISSFLEVPGRDPAKLRLPALWRRASGEGLDVFRVKVI